MTVRKSSFNEETVKEMIELYSAGESLRTIGAKFSANPQTVRRLINKAGVIVRLRGRPRKVTTGTVSSEVPVSDATEEKNVAGPRIVSF